MPHLEGQAPAFHDEEKEITGWELFGLRASGRDTGKRCT